MLAVVCMVRLCTLRSFPDSSGWLPFHQPFLKPMLCNVPPTRQGWNKFTAGFAVGGLSGAAWGYICTQVRRVLAARCVQVVAQEQLPGCHSCMHV